MIMNRLPATAQLVKNIFLTYTVIYIISFISTVDSSTLNSTTYNSNNINNSCISTSVNNPNLQYENDNDQVTNLTIEDNIQLRKCGNSFVWDYVTYDFDVVCTKCSVNTREKTNLKMQRCFGIISLTSNVCAPFHKKGTLLLDVLNQLISDQRCRPVADYLETIKCVLDFFNNYSKESESDIYHEAFRIFFTICFSTVLNSSDICLNTQSKFMTIEKIEQLNNSYASRNIIVTTSLENILNISELGEEDYGSLLTTSDVLSGLTISILLIGLFVVFTSRVELTEKMFLHKHLLISILLSLTCQKVPRWIEKDIKNKSKVVCVFLMIASHYSTLCVYTWLLLEGSNLIMVVLYVLKKIPRKRNILALGYGLPGITTIISIAADYKAFTETMNCFRLNGSLWIIKGPLSVSLLLNFLIFGRIIYFLYENKVNLLSKQNPKRGLLKPFLVMTPLLGLTFIIGLVVEFSPLILGYIYIACNQCIVPLVLLLFIIFDPKVKARLKSRYRNSYIDRLVINRAATMIQNKQARKTISVKSLFNNNETLPHKLSNGIEMTSYNNVQI